MAYAVIAGLPPIYGLYAALIPLLVYPFLGTSRQLITGPVAIDMLIVATGVSMLAAPGSVRYVVLAVLLAGLVGLIQIGMGAVRLGFLADLLSRPVIAGFTAAAALIIGFSQLGNLLGMELARSQYVHELIGGAWQQASAIHPISLAIGVVSIGLLVGIRRWRPLWPEALIVVVGATLVTWAFGLGEQGVTVIGEIPSGLPDAELPALQWSDVTGLLPTALTLALVQFMSVVSLGRVFAARHNTTIDANQELVAVGTANVVGSFFQSIPVSGSFSRSAVNDQAGGRTPLSNVIAAGLVGLTLLFLTPLFYYLPMPALAAIIMVAAAGLVDVQEMMYLFRTRKREGAIALFTFVCTLVIGIQEGIVLGIGASIVAILYRVSRPKMAELGHIEDTRSFHDVARFSKATTIEGLLILRVNAAFSFANAKHFRSFILDKSARSEHALEGIIIDGASINDIDTTAIEALEDIVDQLEEQGIELYFTGLIGPVRDLLRRSGLYERIGADHFFENLHEAVMYILAEQDEVDDGDRLGTYLDTAAPPEPEQEHAQVVANGNETLPNGAARNGADKDDEASGDDSATSALAPPPSHSPALAPVERER
jgi:SulP family sulfate permease